MNKPIFSINSIKNFNSPDNEEYTFIVNEIQTVPCEFKVYNQIYSEVFWNYIKTDYKIENENCIVKCNITIDEKDRQHKDYNYIIRLENRDVFLTFSDEIKNYDEDEYEEYVSENEKKNKIFDLVIYYGHSETKFVTEKLLPEILKLVYIQKTDNRFFKISVSSMGGYELLPAYIKKLDFDILHNYGEKFINVHEQIISKLKSSNGGLYLFHGEPGTGKTTYIRKLISELSESKTIIYIPSYMMEHIANPELISFISSYKDSILLLEDSENILTQNSEDRTQAVSNILNLSDGLLNDSLRVSIIATFNISGKRIMDKALLRAGRLQVYQKFNKLSAEEATKLSAKIGNNIIYKEPKTLAEIYDNFSQIINDDDLNQKKIGFIHN